MDGSQVDNMRNASMQHNNTSGVTGVKWAAHANKWRAEIWLEEVCVHLGYFTSLDDAKAARKSAERQHGFNENHGRPNARVG